MWNDGGLSCEECGIMVDLHVISVECMEYLSVNELWNALFRAIVHEIVNK